MRGLVGMVGIVNIVLVGIKASLSNIKRRELCIGVFDENGEFMEVYQ